MTSAERTRLLVVGASTGVGRAVATEGVRRGWDVVFSSRREEALRAAVTAAGGDAHMLTGDLRSGADCERLVHESARLLGGLDAVVVAGALCDFKSSADSDAESWSKLLETNVIGPALVARAAQPLLAEVRGALVFISSVSARRPWPGITPYAASKAALEAFAAGLQEEHQDIDVSCIALGPTATEVTGDVDRDQLRRMFSGWRETGVVRGRAAMSPEAVAARVLDVVAADQRTPYLALTPPPEP